MLKLDVVIPARSARRWQAEIVARLRAAGHDVAEVTAESGAPWSPLADLILRGEQAVLRPDSLFGRANWLHRRADRAPDLVVDLSGGVEPTSRAPTLALAFAGQARPGAALGAIAAGRLPDLALIRNGTDLVATAAPMIDNRVPLSKGADDVLARAITLVVAGVEAFAAGGLPSLGPAATPERGESVGWLYLTRTLPRLARELWRRARHRSAHWSVGYRVNGGPGVAETGALGSGWATLPDDGARFYADPFVFEADGRHFLFVEDYPYATGKGVISVAAFENGSPGVPRPVLEEPWHLSYPQVFAHGFGIYMLPEASNGRTLTLYRAEAFPDRWVRHAELIADREISDATLIERDGRYWLFATDRDGFGSTSDTMVVWSAEALEGPWVPHRDNPIMIDRRAARPGGAFVTTAGRTLLPVQDGTLGYGGGLGFSELLHLDDERVELAPPRPIATEGDWPHKMIHTYNRAGRIEVIDGIAPLPKRG